MKKQHPFKLITNEAYVETTKEKPELEVIVNQRLRRRDEILNKRIDVKELTLEDLHNLHDGARQLKEQYDASPKLKDLVEVQTQVNDFLHLLNRWTR